MLDKEEALAEKIEELRGIGDKLGRGIDEGILEVVAALNLNGVKTTSSCEGHLGRALSYPWVQIGSEKDEEIETKREKAYKIRNELSGKENLIDKDMEEVRTLENEIAILIGQALKKPIDLINEFYRSKGGGVDDERLIVIDFVDSGRLQSQGGCLQAIRDEKFKEEKLRKYQEEMKRFGEYLKNLYFKE